MLNHDQIEQFIEYRAKNYSFDKISEILNISKPKLISLSKEYESEIQNSRTLLTDQLIEKYNASKTAQVESHLKLLNRLRDEIDNRDLTGVRTDILIKLFLSTQSQIDREVLSKSSLMTTEDDLKISFKKVSEWKI